MSEPWEDEFHPPTSGGGRETDLRSLTGPRFPAASSLGHGATALHPGESVVAPWPCVRIRTRPDLEMSVIPKRDGRHLDSGCQSLQPHFAIVQQPAVDHLCCRAARASLAAVGLIRQRSSQPVGSLVTLRRTSSAGIQ